MSVFQIPCATPEGGAGARIRPCVYGVGVDSAGRVCVALEATGEYYLPGGGIEAGEDAPTALAREVAEEVALAATVGERFATGAEWVTVPETGAWLHKQAAFYRLALGAPLPGATAEHTLVWLAPEEAIARLQYACHRAAVALALNLPFDGG